MKPLFFSGLIGLAGLVLAPVQVRAHGIESSLERLTSLSDSLRLESQFSSGQPASDAAVRIAFTLPPQASRQWEVQVDAGPGHRDYLELPEPAATSPQPARVSRSHPYPQVEGWAFLPPLGVLAVAGLAGMLRPRRPS
jgi:nickel transport protein